MIDPRKLAVSVTAANGSVKRWGGDEPDAFDVPSGITISTKMPGGYDHAGAVLTRPLTEDFSDLDRFSPMRIYGQGNLSAFEGYLAETPREHSTSFTITPSALGWAAHLRDDPSFKEIYVDIDLSKWKDPSAQRQISLNGAYTTYPVSAQADVSTGAPALNTGFTLGAWAATAKPICEPIYNANGIPIGSLYYSWKIKAGVNPADTNYIWNPILADNDTLTVLDATANLRAAGPGTGTLTATTATRVFAVIQFIYNAASAGTNEFEYSLYWPSLAVYGTHGLTKQGTATATSAQGLYGHDVVNNIVSRAAPLLTTFVGTGGVEQDTTLIIPHLAFTDPITAEDGVNAVNRFYLKDWGVYDSKTFFWRAPGSQREWQLRLGDGVKVREEGPQIETSYNGVIVQYSSIDGSRFAVGPPGATAVVTTSASLADTSSTNPLNAFGRRKWAIIDAGLVASSTIAIAIGALFMQEIATRKSRGSAVVTGTAVDSTGVEWPSWYMRAGDTVRFMDTNDTSARQIVDTTYNHDTLEATCNLDSPPNLLDALLQRLQVGLVGIGLG